MNKLIPFSIILVSILLAGCQFKTTSTSSQPSTSANLTNSVKSISKNSEQSSQNPKKYIDAQINTPNLSSPISNPVTITGKISPSFIFESVFPIIIKDANGKQIAKANAHVLSREAMDQPMIPFTVTFHFSNPTTHTGTIIIKNDNPSGLAKYEKLRIFNVIFNNSSTINSVPPALNIQPIVKSNLQTYHNAADNFQISFPPKFKLTPNTDTTNNNIEHIVATITYPDSYSTGTNLTGAKVDLEVTNNQMDCIISAYNKTSLIQSPVKNNIIFYQDKWNEGAAGHNIEHIGYYTWQTQKCYRIVLSMNAANLDNFDPSNRPKAFDRQKIIDIFNQIYPTFKLQ